MFGMKPKDAVMAQRLEFLYIYFRTFFLAAAVLVFVFLFCKIVFRLYRSSKPDKITAINKPPLFNSQTNVNLWLDLFEIYLAEENVKSNKYKCICLLSNLDMECIQQLKYYNDKITNDYNKLTAAMRNLFAVDQKTSVEAALDFSKRQQRPNENIHQYYAALVKLSYDAFSNLTKEQRIEQVGKRLIAGLESSLDQLRCKLLEVYDEKSKSKKDWSKIMEVANRWKDIYGQKQLKVNSIKTSCEHVRVKSNDSNTTVRCLECNPIRDITRSNSVKRQSPQCYNCHEHGHVRATCPLKDSDRKEIINKRLEQRIKETADFFKNNKLEQIRGNCLIDNKLCNFLTDTGSSRTIVSGQIQSFDDKLTNIESRVEKR